MIINLEKYREEQLNRHLEAMELEPEQYHIECDHCGHPAFTGFITIVCADGVTEHFCSVQCKTKRIEWLKETGHEDPTRL